MRKLLSVFIFLTILFGFHSVVKAGDTMMEILDGSNYSIKDATGTVNLISISTSAATQVDAVDYMPTYLRGYVFIVNKSTDTMYCSWVSSLTVATGNPVLPGKSYFGGFGRYINTWCISGGASAGGVLLNELWYKR